MAPDIVVCSRWIPNYRFHNLLVFICLNCLVQQLIWCEHRISIQDLTHDLVTPMSDDYLLEPSADGTQPQFSGPTSRYSVSYGHTFRYVLPSSMSSPESKHHRVQLHLVKPYRLRYFEYKNNQDDVIVDQSGQLPFLQINQVNSAHRGNYTLYRIEFGPSGDNRLVNISRIDFQIVINGLRQQGHQCKNDGQCDSGHCYFGICSCDQRDPISFKNECHPARHFNESCVVDDECQEFGGPDAECYKSWKRCRCNRDTVPIKLTPEIRHCVKMKPLSHGCLFSKQCSLAGDNRYCNASYRCDCLPGYDLVQDLQGNRQCSGLSPLPLPTIFTLLTIISLSMLLFYRH